MWVRSLDQEDPLEWKMGTHSSVLVWRIPGAEVSAGQQCIGSVTTQQMTTSTLHKHYILRFYTMTDSVSRILEMTYFNPSSIPVK